MERYLRHLVRHDALRLDDGTADRLLDGSMSSEDAPPAYRCVARALDALRTEAVNTHVAAEVLAVASGVAPVAAENAPAASLRRSIVVSKRRLTSVVTAALIGGASLFSGLAAANALPGAVQSIASDVLRKVGVSVPDPNSHSGTHASARGQSSEDTKPPASSPSSTQSNGSDTSELAHTTPSTGVDKGSAISTEASGGKSQAGQHGAAATGPPPSSVPPVTTPNRGGTGAAPSASGSHGATGSSAANTQPNGHSAGASTNATDHKP
jgi:hypothetical protein